MHIIYTYVRNLCCYCVRIMHIAYYMHIIAVFHAIHLGAFGHMYLGKLCAITHVLICMCIETR